jgi:hypothetical protein
MIPRKVATLAVAAFIFFSARTGLAQAEIPVVPEGIPSELRSKLLDRKASLEADEAALESSANAHNSKCTSVREGSDTDIACQKAQKDLNARISAFTARVEAFKTDLNNVVTAAKSGSISAETEQASFDRDEQGWLAARAEEVRAAVEKNMGWTKAVLAAIEEPNARENYQITRLSALSAGDVILVAPTDPRRDLSGAALGTGIQGVDYLVRTASDFTTGRAFESAQQVAPVSHALTYVRMVNDKLFFLDHTSEGSRVLDEKEFLRKYGAREMYVARPEAIADGRILWSEAHDAALKGKSDYGLFGENVVCSEKAGIVVARATGLNLSNNRLGPVDITPGDFFDRAGNVGKHFTITRLRITPVNETKREDR